MDILRFKKVSENRYRENAGFYFEDFEPNIIIEHRPGRTITETDNVWQSLITMNHHPIHFDIEYAQQTEFKRLLVNSAVTFSIIGGMSVASLSSRAIANLGWDKVRLLHPLFVGDTLYAESKIISKRASKSRPNQGVVTIESSGYNQDKEKIIQYERTFLVPMKGDSHDSLSNY